jgi:hypothetical protein
MDKDSDLSPSEFVANIRRLGEKKDQEDAERLAKLEEEIEIGRRERELRRAGESVFFLLIIDGDCGRYGEKDGACLFGWLLGSCMGGCGVV